MRKLAILIALTASTPAFAAGKDVGFVSLSNSNFVVMIAFILFIALLLYLKVPTLLGGLLDKRAEGIQSELDEARALREEAQTLLASYERMQKDVQDKAARIVEQARADAATVAAQAKEDLKLSIARRLQAAEDRIASAEAAAVRDVRNSAVAIAVAAARDVIAKQMTVADANKLIDDAINTVDAKLH